MAISSVLVGSLQQGGGLDWQAEVFPRRLLKWDGIPTEELFTVPGDKSFIAFASVYVFSGEHPDHVFNLDSGAQVGYQQAAYTLVTTPDKGVHYTETIGLRSETANRALQVTPLAGYEAPDLSYQVTIWWAELPELPEV